jgi:hypothetical protein
MPVDVKYSNSLEFERIGVGSLESSPREVVA